MNDNKKSITPKSDPDWKEICAKCKDGDIEPKNCEYYGEPNGCNSPIYGEHPTAKKSLVVGNAAKMRKALQEAAESAVEIMERIRHKDGLVFNTANHIAGIVKAALAAPPRNCDVYNNESCRMAYHLHGDGLMTMQAFANWLFATATEKKGGNDGNE